MPLHVPLKVNEDCWEVPVGVVGNACGRDTLEEFGCWKLGGQDSEVLVDQGAQRNAETQLVVKKN